MSLILLSKNIKIIHFLLIFLIGIAAFLRFYNLDWGAPYFFNPDERNIATSVSQLAVPDQLNPNFFAYGSLPIYTSYLIGVIYNGGFSLLDQRSITNVSFEQAIMIGRIVSALFSIGTILLLYKTAIHIMSKKWAFFCAAAACFSVGLIQYAHFGTFESYLTFFSLLLLYFLIKLSKSSRYRFFIYACITIGILISIKISSAVLIPLPILSLLLIEKRSKLYKLRNLKYLIINCLLLFSISASLFILFNPYFLLDFQSFINSISYESAVATGNLRVFYTETFINTVPGIFQAIYIFPFLLNPLYAVIAVPAIIIASYYGIKKRNKNYGIILLFFFFLLIPQLLLYVKWTRYLVPTLPFIYLIISLSLFLISSNFRSKYFNIFISVIVLFVILSGVIWTTALLKTVYMSPDTRVIATSALKDRASDNPSIITEPYDLGVLPFNSEFSNITSFNYYELDQNTETAYLHASMLSQHDFILIPSQRILKSRILNEETFPLGNGFYSSLTSSKRFSLIYRTPCNAFCKILYLGDPVFGVEDTANVFDRPTVYIFRINHEY